MANNALLRISELASKSGVTPRTIRFYVQEGLLSQPVKSRKTLALYNEDCVEKVKAIKKVQSERFLPLVVIRRILEENNFNYAALSDYKPFAEATAFPPDLQTPMGGAERLNLKQICDSQKIPPEAIAELKRAKWIKPEQLNGRETIAAVEYEFIKQFSLLLQKGIDRKDALDLFTTITGLVEKAVDAEIKSIIGWIVKNPILDIDTVTALEEKTARAFFNLIRTRRIRNIIQKYKIRTDNAYLASADEGFALPEDEIIDQIAHLERSLSKKVPDVRVLSDIALGYSCIGHLDKSLMYLRKVLKVDPHNIDAQVRLIWYRRFVRSKSEQIRLRQRLENIVKRNPEFALGHAFLATWYAVEIPETDDHNEILRKINLCFHELELAERQTPRDLHEWVVIHYAKGRIPFWVPISTDYQIKNINAFREILKQKREINAYYDRRMSFFSKWLWPNVYYFYGISLIETGQFKSAEKILLNGRDYNAVAPYQLRLEEAILKAKLAQGKARG